MCAVFVNVGKDQELKKANMAPETRKYNESNKHD